MVKLGRRSWLLGTAATLGCGAIPDVPEVPGRWIGYAGRRWSVRHSPLPADPGLNRWALGPRAVQRHGQHLELRTRTDLEGPWGVELWTQIRAPTRVEFAVTPCGEGLHPDDVVGLFLYRDGRCEVDIELTRWGEPRGPDTFHTLPGREVHSATLGADAFGTRHALVLRPEHVRLESWGDRGSKVSEAALCSCASEGHVLRINLWRRDSRLRPPTRVRIAATFSAP